MSNSKASESLDLVINMALRAWQSQNKQVDKLLEEMPEEQWLKDVAPGRNSGRYLLGHLIAVNDNLFSLLGVGERQYKEFYSLFHDNPDKASAAYPSMAELTRIWREVNEKLLSRFNAMTPEEWLSRHNAITPEDFAREPHRNKLNVVLHRTSHQAYHIGQLILLKRST